MIDSTRPIVAFLLVVVALAGIAAAAPTEGASARSPATPIVLNDDAGWCWYQDERAVVHGGRLFLGTVACGRFDKARQGDIDVTSYDLQTGKITRHTLHKNLQMDDHAAPALLVRPDGRLLALYTRHGGDNRIYYRVSTRLGEAETWDPEQVFVPSERSRVTYSNLYRLASENDGHGRLYDFFRGYDNSWNPSWMFSDDEGATWKAGGLLIKKPGQRPYVKYASDNRETVHFLFTEGHPRNYDNSIYHAYYRGGQLYGSDGTLLGELAAGPIRPEQGTRVFAGDKNNVAWTHDLQIDAAGNPYAVFSVQKDSAGLPDGKGGTDLRYHYARWDGTAWQEQEIAYAGARLFPKEDDYAGGICLHLSDPHRVFCSTNVDPATGKPLSSGHYEIFQGLSDDDGKTWHWSAVTTDSTVDNIRPVVPSWDSDSTALLWARGRFPSFIRYELEVVVQFLPQQAR